MSDAPAYGIIDPDYARAYTIIRKLAADEGYAIGMHGTFTKDLDLIAAPWTDWASAPEHVVNRICDALNLRNAQGNPGIKPHGRRAWSLHFQTFFGDPRYVDLSFMPRIVKEKP